MSDTTLQWVEIVFNVSYLAVIWYLVVRMGTGLAGVKQQHQRVARYFYWAFLLLALGDTGHVGFRVVAFARGGLEQNGVLVGMGALATAITVTIFYVLMAQVWRVRFSKSRGPAWTILVLAAAVRFVLMAFPQNDWSSVVPPADWSLVRNAPLMVQGLGVAALMLRDALSSRDGVFTWIGLMILVSYACYIPVVFFVQQVPIVGMLMIPKTVAYVAIGFIGYRAFWASRTTGQASGKLGV